MGRRPTSCCWRRVGHPDRSACCDPSSCWGARLDAFVCGLLNRHWPLPTHCRRLAEISKLGMGALRRRCDPGTRFIAMDRNAVVGILVPRVCAWHRIDIARVVHGHVCACSSHSGSNRCLTTRSLEFAAVAGRFPAGVPNEQKVPSNTVPFQPASSAPGSCLRTDPNASANGVTRSGEDAARGNRRSAIPFLQH